MRLKLSCYQFTRKKGNSAKHHHENAIRKSTGILQDRQFGSFRNKLQGETGSTGRMTQELCQLQRMWPSSVCHSNFFKSTHMRQEETVRTD